LHPKMTSHYVSNRSRMSMKVQLMQRNWFN
jgi:hypothetical protein